MNGLPLHPILVHVPMALCALMPLIAGGIALAWWRDLLPRRAWWIAALLQATLVVSAFIAMDAGGDDEERVEDVVPESAVEAHEEAAEVFTWTALGLLVPMLLAGFVSRRDFALGAAGVATLGTLVVAGLGVRVGHAGGELVYVHNAGAAWSSDGPAATPGTAGGHDDDDDDDD